MSSSRIIFGFQDTAKVNRRTIQVTSTRRVVPRERTFIRIQENQYDASLFRLQSGTTERVRNKQTNQLSIEQFSPPLHPRQWKFHPDCCQTHRRGDDPGLKERGKRQMYGFGEARTEHSWRNNSPNTLMEWNRRSEAYRS